jgi:hypothetical protein
MGSRCRSEPDFREVQRKIAELKPTEHREIIKLIPAQLLTANTNGTFCDLTKLDQETFDNIREFVNFSTDNNVRLAQYDMDLHKTSMIMERHRSKDIPRSLPDFIKDAPVKSAFMASQLAKQTPKMAFVKRSGDMCDRKTPMQILCKERARI